MPAGVKQIAATSDSPVSEGRGVAPGYERPVELLQRLIRFDTTSPPGNEAECFAYIADLLTSSGCEVATFCKHPSRPNLITRLPGRSSAPPLMLYGHLDVVSTENQSWQR